MFPARRRASAERVSSCAISAVVVVLPFVPVMAMYVSRGRKRSPISISLTISTPRVRAATNGGASGGTPGLATTSDARAMRSRSWPPSWTSTSSRRSSTAVCLERGRAAGVGRVDPRSRRGAAIAPPLVRCAPARPPRSRRPAIRARMDTLRRKQASTQRSLSVLRAKNAQRIPMIQKRTTTCVSFQPFTSKWWCSGARRKTRCACAYSSPCRLLPVLEHEALQDHRHHLGDEHRADEREHELRLEQNRHGAERAAERQRAGVAHEDLGRVGVVPEKSDQRADHREAEDRQLAGVLQVEQLRYRL